MLVWIAHILERRGNVRLLTAIQGRRAVEVAREHDLDLIILDLNLPDIPGNEVLSRLQSDPPARDIPIVMISGFGRDSDEGAAGKRCQRLPEEAVRDPGTPGGRQATPTGKHPTSTIPGSVGIFFWRDRKFLRLVRVRFRPVAVGILTV